MAQLLKGPKRTCIVGKSPQQLIISGPNCSGAGAARCTRHRFRSMSVQCPEPAHNPHREVARRHEDLGAGRPQDPPFPDSEQTGGPVPEI
jgi:hypothetical protein